MHEDVLYAEYSIEELVLYAEYSIEELVLYCSMRTYHTTLYHACVSAPVFSLGCFEGYRTLLAPLRI